MELHELLFIFSDLTQFIKEHHGNLITYLLFLKYFQNRKCYESGKDF